MTPFHIAAQNLLAAAESPLPAQTTAAVLALERAFRAGHKLLVFGNGGSAADAQHISAELVGRFRTLRRPLPAHALTTDPSFLTAWSNDFSFHTVFARQIEAHGRPGDIAWGISTSGDSPSVVEGLSAARRLGLTTFALTGATGGLCAPLADYLMAAPLTETAAIQEVHAVTYHAICAQIEKAFSSPE